MEVMGREERTEPARSIRERVQEAFARECGRDRIAARIVGDPPAFVFEGQEGVSGERILERFLLELRERGLTSGSLLDPSPGATDPEVEERLRGLESALIRIRALLVEFNAYVSGGLPYVFATDDEVLRRRGLSVYRYPSRAAVDVNASEGRVRIAFEPGELGEVTSSGFYVPTRLAGDFEARVLYELQQWSPGPAPAWLALFAQNEPSTLRHYAQVSSRGTPSSSVALAVLAGEPANPVETDACLGGLRLARVHGCVGAWHRALGGGWELLGAHASEPADHMFVGCKIWSGGACGGLTAVLTDFELDGSPAADQGPLPAVRPDPRRATSSAVS
jgi:hypothetical protein